MVDRSKVVGFLIFKGVDGDDLDLLLDDAQELRYDAGVVVMEEDEAGPDSDLFIILDGRAEVLIRSKDAHGESGADKRVTVLGQGEVFGEIGMLEGRRRSAQIKAYTKLTVLKLGRAKLFDHLALDPELGYLVMRNLASILSDRLVDLNFMWRDKI